MKLLLPVFFMLWQAVAFSQPGLQWHDPSASLFPVIQGRGWQQDMAHNYDRLPAKAEAQVNNQLWQLSQNSAGLYIEFKTNAAAIIVQYQVKGALAMPHMPATGVSGVDLYARDKDGQWQWARARLNFADTITFRFEDLALSADAEEFRLYLPLYNSIAWMKIGVAEERSFQFLPKPQEKPIVLYGTSIMQGAHASRPGMAWTNILGRQLDRHLINLGFSGNGLLELPLLNLMNEQDAQLYVLDCLPNLHDISRFSRQDVDLRIRQAVETLQAKHPTTPILLVEHASGWAGVNMDTSLENKYTRVNQWQAETFAALQESGTKHIYLLTADSIGFDIGSTLDGTHPNDAGMTKYAGAYAQKIREILQEPTGRSTTTLPLRQRRDYWVYDFMERHQAVLDQVKLKPPSIALVGNSITHFWGGLPKGPGRGNTSWNKYIEPFNPINLGYGWDRIENVLWRIYHGELDGYPLQKIFLFIGTNNLSIGQTDQEMLEGYTLLINATRSRQPSASVYLAGIFPRHGMEDRIKVLNSKMEGLANTLGVKYINPGAVLCDKHGDLDDNLFSDGLHPNAAGYEKLGAAMQEFLNGN